jgi:hypothetical protein
VRASTRVIAHRLIVTIVVDIVILVLVLVVIVVAYTLRTALARA